MKNTNLLTTVKCAVLTREVFVKAMEQYFPAFENISYDYETGYEVYLAGDLTASHQQIKDALSAFFGIEVTSFHTNPEDESPCVWMTYHVIHKEKTENETVVYKDTKKQAMFEEAVLKAKELTYSGVQITTKYCNRNEQIDDYAITLGIPRSMAAKVRKYLK